MNLEHAFLQDIRDHPDDDLPRLVYADWLEDNSSEAGGVGGRMELAELIRTQIVLHHRYSGPPRWRLTGSRPPSPGDINKPELRPLHERVAFLLARVYDQVREWGCRSCVVQRGLPSALYSSVEQALNQKHLFELYPIKHLGIYHSRKRIDDLISLPYLDRLRSISVHALTSAECLALKTTPGLASLRQLVVQSYTIRQFQDLLVPPTIRPITAVSFTNEEWPSLPARQDGLVLSSFSGPTNFQTELAALARCPHIATLRTLRIQKRSISATTTQALSESPHLEQLEELVLQRCVLTTEAWQQLANARWLPQLKVLRLLTCPLNAGTVEAIAARLVPGRLNRLEVRQQTIPVWVRDNLRGRFGPEAVHLGR
jgi:uncharacterized protein (TIGR02996 family)